MTSSDTEQPKLSVSDFFHAYSNSNKVHPKSLISTFFGDLASPSGGAAWVKTMAQLLAPLGISDRLVRTSLFRLVEEQWLHSTRSGRRSYYQLTAKGKSQTNLAEKLIYSRNDSQWDGHWTMVFVVMEPVDAEARRQLEQELRWIGFGPVSRHVLAHPTASFKMVADRVSELDLGANVVCMRAETIVDVSIGLAVTDREMASRCFSIADLEARYQSFIDLFSRLDLQNLATQTQTQSNSIEMITLRLVLIDEFRRIILQDPRLPEPLLPSCWLGNPAYQLCKDIYLSILSQTNSHYHRLINDSSEGESLLQDLSVDYQQRFSS